MKLQNSFYTITRQNTADAVHSYEVALNASHVIYQAHFPGMPVTPGVCIVQVAKELMEESFHQPLDICRIKNVKFLSVISPAETPSVTYLISKMSEEQGEYKAQVEVNADGVIRAKISMTCIKHEDVR